MKYATIALMLMLMTAPGTVSAGDPDRPGYCIPLPEGSGADIDACIGVADGIIGTLTPHDVHEEPIGTLGTVKVTFMSGDTATLPIYWTLGDDPCSTFTRPVFTACQESDLLHQEVFEVKTPPGTPIPLPVYKHRIYVGVDLNDDGTDDYSYRPSEHVVVSLTGDPSDPLGSPLGNLS